MNPNPRLIPRLNVEFGFRDLRHALQAKEVTEERVLAEVQKAWPGGRPIFVESGRTALFLALQALRLEPGSRVGVPLYTCEAVFEAVVRARCKPVFIDSDTETFTMDPSDLERKASGLQAVIPNHTFGHPADMEALSLAAGKARMIEDCAHSIGSSYRGKQTGILGVASFFSFRLGKPLSVGNLGMLLCNDDAMFERALDLSKGMPQYSGFAKTVQAVEHSCRAALYHKPWFGLVSLPIGSVLDPRLDLMDKAGFEPHLAPPGMLEILAERLRELPERASKTRGNALLFGDALRGTQIPPPVEAPWARHAYYQFAMRLPSSNVRDRASSLLAKQGVDSIKFYKEVPPIALGYGYKRDCPKTELLSETVLTVPCHSQLRPAESALIADALRSLGEIT